MPKPAYKRRPSTPPSLESLLFSVAVPGSSSPDRAEIPTHSLAVGESMARYYWWWLAAAVAWWCAVSAQAQAPPAQNPLQAKCQDDFGKLTDCMDYATGHAAAPASKCCADAGATQRSRPECLCYIIQQVHSGRNTVQSLGLRFDRLLALPTACNLANANVTLCINLLHLTPSSPDYALFANASKIPPSTNTPASDTAAGNSGVKLQAGIRGGGVAAAVISAVLSSIF